MKLKTSGSLNHLSLSVVLAPSALSARVTSLYNYSIFPFFPNVKVNILFTKHNIVASPLEKKKSLNMETAPVLGGDVSMLWDCVTPPNIRQEDLTCFCY